MTKSHGLIKALSCLPIFMMSNAMAEVASSMPELETVTVTAKRFASETMDSTSIISSPGETYALHISDVLFTAPGTWISKGNGQEHLTAIRSPVLVGSGGCGPFLMAEDNISLRAPAFCNVNQLMDAFHESAGSIEVLRGPGSAFHGSNAMHGIINVISPDFSTTPFTRLSADHQSSHGFTRLTFDRRTEDMIIQLLGANDNGYKDDSGYEQQKLRFKYRQQQGDFSFTHNINIAYLDQDTAGYVTGYNAYKDDSQLKLNPNPEAYRKSNAFRYYTDIVFNNAEDAYFHITPYVRSYNMDFLMHFQPGDPLEKNEHHSIGWQSAYHRPYKDHSQLVTGFDFDYSKGSLEQSQDTDIGSTRFPVGLHYDYDVSVLTSAMFIQMDYDYEDDLAITLGVRYEYTRFDYDNQLSLSDACSGDCRYSVVDDEVLDFYNWSPKFDLRYFINEQHAAYLKLAKAFRTPQTFELFRLEEGQSLADINSESINSIEVGFQGGDNRLYSYHIALFSMNKNNVIFKDSDRQNIDDQKTRHHGIEFDLSIRFNEYLSLSTQLSYAKHQYDSDIQLFNTSTENINGNLIDTAPRHNHHLSLEITPDDAMKFVIDANYIGHYYLDAENTFSYPGHTLINLHSFITLEKDLKLTLSVLNASNRRYADRADVTVTFFGSPPKEERYFIGEPRSFSIGIEKTFR